MTDPSLLPFFSPGGILVLGASTSPDKLGYGVARNLVHCGYKGAVHLVGQKPGELFGRPLYMAIDRVPDPVDLAVLIVPPHAAAKAIEECGKRGIRAAIVMSSGFREVGAEGAGLEAECLETARAYGVRLLGPNCIGTIDTHQPLDTSFLPPPMPSPGAIGFISQSGAFCAAIVDWARGQDFGFSRIVSLGNQADVNETDVLSVLGEDEQTRVIVMYMESVSEGRRFVDAARQVNQHKPVIALKVGRLEAGQKAAASHTGALAASDNAFEAAFEKAGILRADSAEQMFDWARILEAHPHGLPMPSNDAHQASHGNDQGIAILTNAGGPGVIAADALEKFGVPLAKLHEPTLKALIAELPPAASVFNPVDMLASASPDAYAACLELLLRDENVKGVLVILPPPPVHKAEDVAEKLIALMEANNLLPAISKPLDPMPKKPVVAALLGSTLVEEARTCFGRAGIPVYPFPERAASAFGALVKRAEYTRRERSFIPSTPRPVSMAGHSLEEVLGAYGIPFIPMKLARSVEEAGSIAWKMGYPVVMKIASPDILHKSDAGGVALNIEDASSLRAAHAKMMELVREKMPLARIEGVHIQKQIPAGQEVIVGAVRDPQFGPMMMFGSGGLEVEGLKDVAFALAPLTAGEASHMIHRTWAGRKLAGFRNIPPADEGAVVEILLKLSSLVSEQDFIQEIEINPLRVSGQGALAVDVRMKG